MTIKKYLLLLAKRNGDNELALSNIKIINIEKNGNIIERIDFNFYWWKTEKYPYFNHEFEAVYPKVDYGSQMYLTFVLKENDNVKI